MNKIKGLVRIIFLLILLDIVILGYFYLWENPFEGPKFLQIRNSNKLVIPTNLDLNLSDGITQFYPGLRFNHKDISFYIDPGCGDGKKIRMLQAFLLISEETGVLDFYPFPSDTADILIDCSGALKKSEEKSFIAGEGGPTKILNSTIYPIIVQGRIILYNESSCKEPVVEVHELLHVLGFEHINNPERILFPYLECSQTIDPRIIKVIQELYLTEALPELYFKEISTSRSGIYLDFNVLIKNEGIGDAEGVLLQVYDGTVESRNKVGSFNLETIKMGEGKALEVKNLRISFSSTDKIIFVIESDNSEYSFENNQIGMVL